jgi:hypothetical protein
VTPRRRFAAALGLLAQRRRFAAALRLLAQHRRFAAALRLLAQRRRFAAALRCRASQAHACAVLGATLALGWLLAAASVQADQPRDFMLAVQPTGTFLLLDYFGTGGQATLENRIKIFGEANDFTTSLAVVPAYTLGETVLRADLRILFLSIGGTVGYRVVWRDLTFEPGKDSYCKDCDRGARRDLDPIFGRTAGSDRFGMAEVRARLLLPINDYVVMDSVGALRYEDRHDRSFDWFYTSIYDRGVLGRWEVDLFVKHRDWGGIGPYLQLLMLPRDGGHHAQWAVGFNAVTRAGIVARNDLLFLTFLMRPGDPIYGQQNYFAPIRALLIYRLILDL